MSRADLLALSTGALTDLTNPGTVRRATKEVEQGKVSWEIVESPDGALSITFSDDVRCTIPAYKPFSDWTCTCAAGASCRHLVRAVLVYQREAVQTEPTATVAEPTATEAEPTATEPEPGPQPAAVDPGQISDEALQAALGAATWRKSQPLVAAGPLGLVGLSKGMTVVRIYFPQPAAVRFLAGPDLNYVTCSCADRDPCAHVPVAVAIARGEPFHGTGLRVVAGDTWRPDPNLLDEAVRLIDELLTIGVAAAHRSGLAPWHRFIARASEVGLYHLAEIGEQIVAELQRYAQIDERFQPEHLVDLMGELAARVVSLRGTHPERVPDRVVAGSRSETVQLGTSKLIGLGTEFRESGEDVVAVAHLVDARSGMPLRVTKASHDPDYRPSYQLAQGRVGGAPLNMWGAGQVMSSGGKRMGAGDYSPGNRRVTTMPRAALEQLAPPFGVGSLDELTAHQTQLPRVLDDRAAGTGLAAVRFARVEDVGYLPWLREVRATCVDADGARATLAIPVTTRTSAAAWAAGQLLESWVQAAPETLYVAGRWQWGSTMPMVHPFLVQGDDQALQPCVARGIEGQEAPQFEYTNDEVVSGPAAVVQTVAETLGATVVAGLDRVREDLSLWQDLPATLRAAGSVLMADAVEAVVTDPTPSSVRRLLVAVVFARPLV